MGGLGERSQHSRLTMPSLLFPCSKCHAICYLTNDTYSMSKEVCSFIALCITPSPDWLNCPPNLTTKAAKSLFFFCIAYFIAVIKNISLHSPFFHFTECLPFPEVSREGEKWHISTDNCLRRCREINVRLPPQDGFHTANARVCKLRILGLQRWFLASAFGAFDQLAIFRGGFSVVLPGSHTF